MSFIMYDIGFLVIFTIFVSIFLYSRRKNLKREGLLFLYRAQWGVKLINYIGKKYQKTLYVFSYLVIGLGYILMVTMIYLFGKIVYLYIAFPSVVRAIKVPPIMPLIPYLPSVFKLDFLPPFYFTYWIVILAIVAITHEFSHGIFARRYDIGIKSTGFGFLGPFLAAFVELDEKKMAKKKKFEQLSILSAGTFANVLTAIFFFIVLVIFFHFAFTPSGVVFDSYSYSLVPVASITSVNGIVVHNLSYSDLKSSLNSNFTHIMVDGKKFLGTKDFVESQDSNSENVILYDDAPAVRNNLKGAIYDINGVKIKNIQSLSDELSKYSPGDTVNLETIGEKGEIISYDITLDKNPLNDKPWLGIGFSQRQSSGILGRLYTLFASFKQDHVYYMPKDGGMVIFIYDMLWWLILISVSVALVNMLPVGIFDGGRVYYLTVLAITKNEKVTKKIFTWTTYLFLFLLFLLMVFWAISFL